jgi:hypothetical protein
MTTPTIFATGYVASSVYSAPKQTEGSPIAVRTSTTIPVSTATNTLCGLVPFRKGARVVMRGSSVYVTDADTGSTATCTLGWAYVTGSSGTDDVDGFATTSTAPQTGGIIAFDAVAGYAFTAVDDGWVVLATGGETVEVAYTATADVVITYNQ